LSTGICLKTTVLNQCGDKGFQLVFPATASIYDAAGKITNLPEKFKYKDDPPLPAANASAATRDAYNAAVTMVEKWNKNLESFFTDIRTYYHLKTMLEHTQCHFQRFR
jgi:hypothetical protein